MRKYARRITYEEGAQALLEEFGITVVDKTDGTYPLAVVLADVLAVLRALAAVPLIGRVLGSPRLQFVEIEAGEHITDGAQRPSAIANYLPARATLFVAAGLAFAHRRDKLRLGESAHNVGLGFRTVLAHEVAHMIQPEVEQAATVVMAQLFDAHPKDYWQQAISEYAGHDSQECFAEAFAAYVHPSYAPEEHAIPEEIAAMFARAGIGERQRGDEHLEKAKKGKAKKGKTIITSGGQKVTSSDMEDILDIVDDADWALIEGALTKEMLEQFKEAGQAEIEAMGMGGNKRDELLHVLDREAKGYVHDHGADLVVGLKDSTRDLVRGTLEDALQEGWSKPELTEELSNNFAFSDVRAARIAHTELAMAHSYGRVDVAKEAGASKKKWMLSADHDPDEDCYCSDAADEGWIDLDENFPGGYDYPPGHPNCWCDWVSDLSGGDKVAADDVLRKDYDEDKHPRDEQGHFVSTGGGKPASTGRKYGLNTHQRLRIAMREAREADGHTASQKVASVIKCPPPAASDENVQAITRYVSSSSGLNTALRSSGGPTTAMSADTQNSIATLDNMVRTSRAYMIPIKMTRGVPDKAIEGKGVGDTFVDHGYVSTSFSANVASGFGDGTSRLEITVPKGFKFLSVPSFRAGAQKAGYTEDDAFDLMHLGGREAEAILPRGTGFQITKISKEGGRRVVHVNAVFSSIQPPGTEWKTARVRNK